MPKYSPTSKLSYKAKAIKAAPMTARPPLAKLDAAGLEVTVARGAPVTVLLDPVAVLEPVLLALTEVSVVALEAAVVVLTLATAATTGVMAGEKVETEVEELEMVEVEVEV